MPGSSPGAWPGSSPGSRSEDWPDVGTVLDESAAGESSLAGVATDVELPGSSRPTTVAADTQPTLTQLVILRTRASPRCLPAKRACRMGSTRPRCQANLGSSWEHPSHVCRYELPHRRDARRARRSFSLFVHVKAWVTMRAWVRVVCPGGVPDGGPGVRQVALSGLIPAPGDPKPPVGFGSGTRSGAVTVAVRSTVAGTSACQRPPRIPTPCPAHSLL